MLRVDLEDEVKKYGLRLCAVSDLNPHNFMKDQDIKLVALDFGGYSFLPISFTFALKYHCAPRLAQILSQRLKYPQSENYAALIEASCALVPFGKN